MWLLAVVFAGFIAAWVYLDARDVGLSRRRSLAWAVGNFVVPVIGLLVYLFVEHGRVPVLKKPSIEQKSNMLVVLVPVALIFFMNDAVQNQSLRLDPAITILHGLLVVLLPFIVAGVFISALTDRFVPTRTSERGSLWASLVVLIGSMVIPLCAFGLAPLARRLLLKGFPRGTVFGMLFLGSIVNPIVAWSLYVALGRDLHTTVTVLAAGVLGAFLVGWLMSLATRDEAQTAEIGGFETVVGEGAGGTRGFCEKALLELAEYVKYVVVGGIYAALLAIMIPKGAIAHVTESALGSGLSAVLTAFAVPTAPMGMAHFGSSYAAVWPGGGAPIAFILFSLTCCPAAFFLLIAATKPRVAGLYLGISLVFCLLVSMALSRSAVI
jgi:uncharacterized membrane protein YraQ (UPF0718 family)